MKQFVLKILVVSAILMLIGWLTFTLIVPEYYIQILPFMVLFFLVVTLLVHGWQLKMAKKSAAKFTRSNMLLILVKLILYSVFAIVYIALKPENALVFVIALFVLYLVFSFIEVTELNKISKNINHK